MGRERIDRKAAIGDSRAGREASNESVAVLWRAWDASTRALGDDSQASGQYRLPTDRVALDALLRALWPYRVYPLPRLSRRHVLRLLPALRGRASEQLHC